MLLYMMFGEGEGSFPPARELPGVLEKSWPKTKFLLIVSQGVCGEFGLRPQLSTAESDGEGPGRRHRGPQTQRFRLGPPAATRLSPLQ